MPWGHGVNCRLSGMGPQEPSSRGTKTRAEGQVKAPSPRGLFAHGAGLRRGGAASPRAGAFRPPPLAARGSLSLSWDFAAGLPLSAALELIPSARGEAPVTPGLPHPRGLSPIPPGSAAGQRPGARGRISGEGPCPGRDPRPRPARGRAPGVSSPPARSRRSAAPSPGRPPRAGRAGAAAAADAAAALRAAP